jgi:hypothetical protein
LSHFNKEDALNAIEQERAPRTVKRKAHALETEPDKTKPKKKKLLATKDQERNLHDSPSKRPLYDAEGLALLRSTLVGPKWDSINWSCAYDAVLFFIHASLILDGQTWMSNCECPLRDNDGGGGYGMRFYCGYVIWFGTLYRDAVLITNIDTPP